jgi:hypothetical protein
VETLRQLVEQRFYDSDLRYQQRYDAQNKALDAALLAAEKAVQTALLAAKDAVDKAERAAEKRFESVNEFRAQLSDQAATFMPRLETEQRIGQLADRNVDLQERLIAISQRIDQTEGRVGGHQDSTRNLVTIVGLALTAITVLVGVYLAFRK